MPMEKQGSLGATAIRAGCFVIGSAIGVMAWVAFAPHPPAPVEQRTFIQQAGESSSTPAKIPTTLTIQSADAVEVPGPGDEGTIDPTTQNPPGQAAAPRPAEVTITPASTPPPSISPSVEPPPTNQIAPDGDKVWGAGETPGTGDGTITAYPSATASNTTPPASPTSEVPSAEVR